MGRYSKGKSNRGSGRKRMHYEDNIDSGLAGAKHRRDLEAGGNTSRIAREAKGAQISNTRLSAASALDEAPATLLAERDRRRKRTKRRVLMVLTAVGALLLGVIAVGAVYYLSLHNRMTVSSGNIPQALLDTPTPEPAEPFNLAIFGHDARDPDEYDLTDTIILARVDPEQQKMWMVSIPRDTRVELPGHGAKKINSAYLLGGPNMAIQALEDITGQDIDYFMTVNFWGFEEIIDAIGGVHIDVPIAINDPRADFTPDRSASLIAPGPQILDGAHALTFVRHRDGYVDADLGRTRAQQLFFRALIEQLGDVSMMRLPGIASSLADNVVTNFTPLQLLQLGRDMRGIGADDFYAITLPGEWRSPFVWVDEEAAAEVWENFGVRSFEPSEDDEDVQELSIEPSDISLTVRNGTTRVGIGREAAAVMRARGFIVEDIGNTDNQAVYDENMVVYTDNRQAAELVAQFMPAATRVVQSRGMFRFESEVLVILGSEWDLSEVPVVDVTSE